MKFQRLIYFSIAFSACLILSVTSIHGLNQPLPPDSEIPATTVQLINERIIQNPQSVNLSPQLVNRKQLLLEVLQENPAQAVNLMLAPVERNRLPVSFQKEVEMPVQIGGKVEYVISDDFDNRKSKSHYYLATDDGEKVQLHFTLPPSAEIAGNTVTVKGLQIENHVLVQNTDQRNLQILEKPDVLGVMSSKKIAVILVNFQSNPSQPYTPEYIRRLIITNTGKNGVNQYYKEVSHGKFSFEGALRTDGDVFGWYTISSDPAKCPIVNEWFPAAEAQAVADGFVKSNYQTVIYMTSRVSCGANGFANLPQYNTSTYAWINENSSESYLVFVLVHELGHTLGVLHANGLDCITPGGQGTAVSNDCVSIEYYDPFDVMGYRHFHLNSYHRARMGFFDPGNYQFITTDGDYNLEAAEPPGQGIKTLIIQRGGKLPYFKINTSTEAYYYLELRKPYGLFDPFELSDPVVNGVSVRIASHINTADPFRSYLIDSTPTESSFFNSPLSAGNTITDYAEGISLTTLSVTDSQAKVRISFSPKVCVRSNPIVTSDNSTLYKGPAGSEGFYLLNISNRDSSACGDSTYALSAQLPAGFSQRPASYDQNGNPISSFILSPQETAYLAFYIKSPATSAPGEYLISEFITNSNMPVYKSRFDLSYVVTDPNNQCLHLNPGLTFTTNDNLQFLPGIPYSFAFLVLNQDLNNSTNTCAASRFQLSSAASLFFTVTIPQPVYTIAPQQSAYVNFNIMVNPNTPIGVYQLYFTATNLDASPFKTEKSLLVEVVPCQEDLNQDGMISAADVKAAIYKYIQPSHLDLDINYDRKINNHDIVKVMSKAGRRCP